MTIRSNLGVLAAVFGLLGLGCGMSEWFLSVIVAPNADPAMWDTVGNMIDALWAAHIFFYGSALILVGVAVAMPVKTPAPQQTQPDSKKPEPAPPPLPAVKPAPVASKPVPVEETRAAEDLWQSADAPFPTPPSIEHTPDESTLWQSDQSPFPKVDVPEDEEEDESAPRNER